MPYSVIGRQTVWGHQLRWTSAGNISVNPTNPDDVTVVFADRGTAEPERHRRLLRRRSPATAPAYDPCNAGPSSNTNVYTSRSTDGGATWTGRQVFDARRGPPVVPVGRPQVRRHPRRRLGRGRPASRRRPRRSTTSSSTCCAPRRGKQTLGPQENLDVSVTHWAGQYVPAAGLADGVRPGRLHRPPVTDAEGKDCNVFHGDYTGLAVDSARPGARGLDRPEPLRPVARSSTPTPADRTTATPRTPCTPADNSKQTITEGAPREAPLPSMRLRPSPDQRVATSAGASMAARPSRDPGPRPSLSTWPRHSPPRRSNALYDRCTTVPRVRKSARWPANGLVREPGSC